MNQQRNTRTQIQGIVNMVFDICESREVEPTAENFYKSICDWIIHGKTPTIVTIGKLVKLVDMKKFPESYEEEIK